MVIAKRQLPKSVSGIHHIKRIITVVKQQAYSVSHGMPYH
jgi:hypothetical protein